MPGRDQEPSIQLASGTTDERDGSYNISNTLGSIFYNTDKSNVEVYHEDPSNNVGWRDLVMNNKEQIDISGNVDISGNLGVSETGLFKKIAMGYPAGHTIPANRVLDISGNVDISGEMVAKNNSTNMADFLIFTDGGRQYSNPTTSTNPRVGDPIMGVAQFISDQSGGRNQISVINSSRADLSGYDKSASIGFITSDTDGTQKLGGSIGFNPSDKDSIKHEFVISQSLTSSGYAAPTEVLRINNLGNVGIGTTTPSQNLDVIGNIRASGNVLSTPVLFRVSYHTSSGNRDKSLASGVTFTTNFVWDNINNNYHDYGNGTGNGIFTATIAGIYAFYWGAYTNSSQDYGSRPTFYKNDVAFALRGSHVGKGNSIYTTVHLNVGDNMRVKSSYHSLYFFSYLHYNEFSGHLVQAT